MANGDGLGAFLGTPIQEAKEQNKLNINDLRNRIAESDELKRKQLEYYQNQIDNSYTQAQAVDDYNQLKNMLGQEDQLVSPAQNNPDTTSQDQQEVINNGINLSDIRSINDERLKYININNMFNELLASNSELREQYQNSLPTQKKEILTDFANQGILDKLPLTEKEKKLATDNFIKQREKELDFKSRGAWWVKDRLAKFASDGLSIALDLGIVVANQNEKNKTLVLKSLAKGITNLYSIISGKDTSSSNKSIDEVFANFDNARLGLTNTALNVVNKARDWVLDKSLSEGEKQRNEDFGYVYENKGWGDVLNYLAENPITLIDMITDTSLDLIGGGFAIKKGAKLATKAVVKEVTKDITKATSTTITTKATLNTAKKGLLGNIQNSISNPFLQAGAIQESGRTASQFYNEAKAKNGIGLTAENENMAFISSALTGTTTLGTGALLHNTIPVIVGNIFKISGVKPNSLAGKAINQSGNFILENSKKITSGIAKLSVGTGKATLSEGFEEGLIGLVNSVALQGIDADGSWKSDNINIDKAIKDMTNSATMGAVLGTIIGGLGKAKQNYNERQTIPPQAPRQVNNPTKPQGPSPTPNDNIVQSVEFIDNTISALEQERDDSRISQKAKEIIQNKIDFLQQGRDDIIAQSTKINDIDSNKITPEQYENITDNLNTNITDINNKIESLMDNFKQQEKIDQNDLIKLNAYQDLLTRNQKTLAELETKRNNFVKQTEVQDENIEKNTRDDSNATRRDSSNTADNVPDNQSLKNTNYEKFNPEIIKSVINNFKFKNDLEKNTFIKSIDNKIEKLNEVKERIDKNKKFVESLKNRNVNSSLAENILNANIKNANNLYKSIIETLDKKGIFKEKEKAKPKTTQPQKVIGKKTTMNIGSIEKLGLINNDLKKINDKYNDLPLKRYIYANIDGGYTENTYNTLRQKVIDHLNDKYDHEKDKAKKVNQELENLDSFIKKAMTNKNTNDPNIKHNRINLISPASKLVDENIARNNVGKNASDAELLSELYKTTKKRFDNTIRDKFGDDVADSVVYIAPESIPNGDRYNAFFNENTPNKLYVILHPDIDNESLISIVSHERLHQGFNYVVNGKKEVDAIKFKQELDNLKYNKFVRDVMKAIKDYYPDLNESQLIEEAVAEIYSASENGNWKTITNKYNVEIPKEYVGNKSKIRLLFENIIDMFKKNGF